MFAVLGSEVFLPAARARPEWSWGNLQQLGEVNRYMTDMRTIWEKFFGVDMLKLLLVLMISLGPIFLFLHHAVLNRFSPVYRKLAPSEQIITCQHSVYALVFGLSLVPQTTLAVFCLFRAWTGVYLASWQLTILAGVLIGSRGVLYLVEACVRSLIKPSWLLLVHHTLFYLIIILGLWGDNIAVLGIGIVLDLFACHEAPLYLALVAYRLQWRQSVTLAIVSTACVWYLLTRVIQTAFVGYMIIAFARMPNVRHTTEFIVTALLFGAFTFIQAYTLVIYHSIYRKVSGCRTAPTDSAKCGKASPATVRKEVRSSASLSSSVDGNVDVDVVDK